MSQSSQPSHITPPVKVFLTAERFAFPRSDERPELPPVSCALVGTDRYSLWLPEKQGVLFGVSAIKTGSPIHGSDHLRVILSVNRPAAWSEASAAAAQEASVQVAALANHIYADWPTAYGLTSANVSACRRGTAILETSGPWLDRPSSCVVFAARSVRSQTRTVGNVGSAATKVWKGFAVELDRPFDARELADWFMSLANAIDVVACGYLARNTKADPGFAAAEVQIAEQPAVAVATATAVDALVQN